MLDAHCSGLGPQERYLSFDVHCSLPLLVTAGNDGRLIVRDYEKNVVLGNYLCDESKEARVAKLERASV